MEAGLKWRRDQISPDRFFLLILKLACVPIIPMGTIMLPVSNSKSLGELIRKERKAQQLTQEQLAGLIGVGVRFVRELEAGKENCRLGLALQVAAGLGLTVSISDRREGVA
jgi:y4mF family transcriptional regulator